MELTKDNYFSLEADRKYMSVSQYKNWLSCPAAEKARQDGEWVRPSSVALLQGQYLHAWNENALPQFREEHPELFKKDGTLLAKYKMIGDCIDKVANDELAMKLLTGGEVEVIGKGQLFGVPWKIMIDRLKLKEGTFIDLKCMKDFHSKYWDPFAECYVNFVDSYKYNLQMVIYQEIAFQAFDKMLQPHILGVTKENPPDIDIFIGFQADRDYLLDEVKHNMPSILDMKEGKKEAWRCEKCAYCRETKKARIINYKDIIF